MNRGRGGGEGSEVMSRDPRWDTDWRELIGPQFGNRFAYYCLWSKHDVTTPAGLADAIVNWGLAPDLKSFALEGPCKWPYVRGAGVGTWRAVLDVLEELSFDWKRHVRPQQEKPASPIWEYLYRVWETGDLEEWLNQRGAESWELVSGWMYTWNDQKREIVLKRRIR